MFIALQLWLSGSPSPGVSELLLDLGVVAGGPPRSLLQPLVLLVAAVVLLDEDGRPAALLEPLLLVVRPELGLDQDGRLSHLLVESVLRGGGDRPLGFKPTQRTNKRRDRSRTRP